MGGSSEAGELQEGRGAQGPGLLDFWASTLKPETQVSYVMELLSVHMNRSLSKGRLRLMEAPHASSDGNHVFCLDIKSLFWVGHLAILLYFS